MLNEIDLAKKNNELIKKFQVTRDEKIFNELFKINQGIIHSVVNNHSYYYSKSYTIITKEDAIAVGNYAFYVAVKNFDESKGFAFSTYFSKICKRELEHVYLYIKRHEFPTISMDQKAYNDDEGSDILVGDLIPDLKSEKEFAAIEQEHVNFKMFEKIKKILRPAEFFVFKHVMQKNKTLVEIGKECNVTKQRINNLYISALKKISAHKHNFERFMK